MTDEATLSTLALIVAAASFCVAAGSLWVSFLKFRIETTRYNATKTPLRAELLNSSKILDRDKLIFTFKLLANNSSTRDLSIISATLIVEMLYPDDTIIRQQINSTDNIEKLSDSKIEAIPVPLSIKSGNSTSANIAFIVRHDRFDDVKIRGYQLKLTDSQERTITLSPVIINEYKNE